MEKRALKLVKKPTLARNLADALTGKGWNRGLDGKVGSRGYDVSEAMHDGALVGVASRKGYVAERTYDNSVEVVADYARSGEGNTVVYIAKGLRIDPDRLAGDAWWKRNEATLMKGHEGLRSYKIRDGFYELREAA